MISVIIPVYNVEKYLDKTIKSVLNQTYTNFELILVDDGSTDKSGVICDRYAVKDDRVVVIHQLNSGVSAARNAGLNRFKGDYLTFIDSDDYVEPEYFKTAMSCFKVCPKIEAAIFGINMVQNNQVTPNPLKCIGIMDTNEYLKKAMSPSDIDFGGGYPVNKVWKIKDRRSVGYFDETLFSKEDRLWVFQMLLGCKKVWLDKRIFYNYVYNTSSLTHSKKDSSERRINGIDAFKKISMLNYNDPELQDMSYNSFCHMLIHRFCEGLLNKDLSSVTNIYIKYRTEWNKICSCIFKTGKLKVKIEAAVCYISGHTLCELYGKKRDSK